jgi:hypothetical protein
LNSAEGGRQGATYLSKRKTLYRFKKERVLLIFSQKQLVPGILSYVWKPKNRSVHCACLRSGYGENRD